MKLSTLAYHFRESFRGFHKTGVMAMATISTVAVSLTILGGFLIFYANLTKLLHKIENNLQVSFYLDPSASETDIKDLITALKADKRIKSFELISKEEALEKLRKELSEESYLLDNLSENPLPDSVEVSLYPISDWKDFEQKYGGMKAIGESKTGQEWVDRVMKLITISQTAGWIVLILLGLANLFIIANTIRLTVFARRQEIEIMRLVGATNWFIRTPFLMEGVLQGIIGAVIASLLLGLGYSFLQDSLKLVLPGLELATMTDGIFQLHLKLIFLGLALGMLGSLFSLRKFLV